MSAILYKDELIGGSKDPFPVATILPFASKSYLPAGFMTCEGQAISRAMYPDLFRAIGTEYGAGDGETTFNLPDLTKAAWLNGTYDKTVFETAGEYTFTAPKTGYYKITIKGAGGGGGGGEKSGLYCGGTGGGEGGTTISFEYMTTGDIASIVIGAGGLGGVVSGAGGNGGDSSVVVNSNTYTGGGGGGGSRSGSSSYGSGGGIGGNGTIKGCAGASGYPVYNNTCNGANGGGTGGGNAETAGVYGGGGGGGNCSASASAGAAGGDGYCWIEFIGTTPFYIIKTFGTQSNDSALIDMTQYATALAEKADKADGVPLGVVLPFSGNGSLPAGYLLCDGSAVSRSMYEDLFGVIGTTYGEGDGVETFNLPDLGFVDGEEADVYGKNASMGLRSNLSGEATSGQDYTMFGNSSSGLNFTQSSVNIGFNISPKGSSTNSNVYTDLTSAVSNKVRYIIKAFNGMNTHGALLDLTGMANELNRKYDARTDFTIIYPNGGSAESPANVTNNNRYVEANPFAGYHVACQAEILIDGTWGNPLVNSGHGISANEFDGNIIVRTLTSGLGASPANTGSPFPVISSSPTSAPCRVKVWKVGKI